MKNFIALFLLLLLSSDSSLYSQIIYSNSFGSPSAEAAFTSILSKSGHIYTVGWTENTSNGNSDVLVIKTDKSRVKIWEKTYGMNDRESGISLTELSNGNILIGGSGRSVTNGLSDCLLISINENGDELWTRAYGTTEEDYLRKVIELPTNDLLICGYTDAGNGGKDLLAIKIDEAGGVVWATALGSIADEEGWTVDIDDAGNAYFGGWSKSTSNGNSDFYLVKMNPSGDKIFEKTFGGSNVDSGLSLVIKNNNIFFAGSTLSYGNGKSDILLYRINLDGDIISYETYGSAQDDYCRSICATESGFCLAGYTTGFNSLASDMLVALADDSGKFTQYFIIDEPKDQDAWGALYTGDNTILITGRGVNPNRSDYDVKLISYRIGTSSNKEIFSRIHVYPNPAVNVINLPEGIEISGLEILNSMGVTLLMESSKAMNQLDISDLPAGFYFLKIKGFENNHVIKFEKF